MASDILETKMDNNNNNNNNNNNDSININLNENWINYDRIIDDVMLNYKKTVLSKKSKKKKINSDKHNKIMIRQVIRKIICKIAEIDLNDALNNENNTNNNDNNNISNNKSELKRIKLEYKNELKTLKKKINEKDIIIIQLKQNLIDLTNSIQILQYNANNEINNMREYLKLYQNYIIQEPNNPNHIN